MKIHYSLIGQYPETEQSLEVNTRLTSGINVLVIVHLFIFIVHSLSEWLGFLELPLFDGTVSDYITACLSISSTPENIKSYWWLSIFTHQFIHINWIELLLSTSMLWLFGHLLEKRIGERNVILLYCAAILLTAITFILSHFIFRVFSGPDGTMEGAFGGVLSIMTATLLFYNSYQLRIGSKILLPVWQLYILALLLSLIVFYKNNMAYILVYACSIYTGYWYSNNLLKKQT